MGNNSILNTKERILELIMSATDLKDADNIHILAHAYEVLTQCEHMSLAINGKSTLFPDFPPNIDFE